MISYGSCVVDSTPVAYHLTMTWEETWRVLRWVLAALAAGFIGQFGKSFALYVLRRRRARRADEAKDAVAPSVSQPTTAADVERARVEALAKIEKKRAKAEVKRLKKS